MLSSFSFSFSSFSFFAFSSTFFLTCMYVCLLCFCIFFLLCSVVFPTWVIIIFMLLFFFFILFSLSCFKYWHFEGEHFMLFIKIIFKYFVDHIIKRKSFKYTKIVSINLNLFCVHLFISYFNISWDSFFSQFLTQRYNC